MNETHQKQLGVTLWGIADKLRGAMNADDFRDYMLSFLFLRYLSDNYEAAAKKELGSDYLQCEEEIKKITIAANQDDVINALKEQIKNYFNKQQLDSKEKNSVIEEHEVLLESKKMTPLVVWYINNLDQVATFEKQMRRKVHFVIKPQYLWSNIYELARTQNKYLLKNLQAGFKFIENESFDSTFRGLFSEVNLDSDKLGKNYELRNTTLCSIITAIAEGLSEFPNESDLLGDAYEYLIGQFAAGSGKKAGEFYTPQQISTILSRIVTLDSQDPSTGKKEQLKNILDFACGSGSLLINVRKQLGANSIGQIYGQEKNITTYNLARMNMLLHGLKDSEFKIFHGDSLLNDWDMLTEMNPAKKLECDAVVANPPFSYRWEPNDTLAEDFRFKSYGLAPKSAADFAFLLHGFHFLSDEGTMAIILPHGVLFRGGAEEKIRTKLLKDGNIDTIIGLPANLFFSTGIPVCILVLKKCKKFDDVLFINASEYYDRGKRQNVLLPDHIDKIVETYKYRKEDDKKYSRRVSMDEIEKNDFNLNISRYVSTVAEEEIIDLADVKKNLDEIEVAISKAKDKHNQFLKELGLPELS
ncbi:MULTISPECIES: type I restriction-modification system subunit M [Bacillus]|uniref:site-specific DNA-methyltransferase (adenine-specific) n=1 Tax=Bacillus cereus TaxID=1396 RepID=A0A9X5ZFZ2_BACCE|nr:MULTISPECIES: type I restriction-modification system subunit M [Bacillus]MDV8111721.1 type I restriction-modification system subunit M [Bacillus sp. BAU-SS-2023]CJC18457.1 restriction-modification enzyme type I M subunit [Streptococcus pneumoniae]AQQ61668.1 Site-specific DNA-methyltransferasee (adenine-specific) [Bacillus cereus]MCP1138417.1 type I restriction-modification system subunit M [Bacillus cereus]MCT4481613.1 type I restriction-modification system subunit M [Bacillus sp. DN_7.5]